MNPPSITFDQPLPSSVQTERMVLGSILSNPANWIRCVDLSTEDFSMEKHRRIFRRMKELAESGVCIDHVTLYQALQAHDETELVDGLSYIVSLDEHLPDTPEVSDYCQILIRQSQRRSLIVVGNEMIREAFSGALAEPPEIMERAGKRISDVAARTPGQKLTADTLGESLELAGGLDAILSSRRGVVPTPLPSLTQEMAGGFSEGELIVLAARPKLGKSAFALQCGVHAAQRGQSVQMFSLEMSRVSNLQRLYSAQSGVPLSLIRGGWLDTLHLRAIAQAAADSEQWPLVIEDRIGSLNGIMQSIRQKRPQLAIIDYLGLITPPARNFGTRNNEISFMTRQLKMLAGEVGIPILLLAQLNREVEHEKRSPRLSDLRDSGSIEQDADIVLFLHRSMAEAPIELIVGVQRNGPGGKAIPMYWEGNICRFQEMEDRNL